MKKFTAVLLMLCMSYVLVGCDNGGAAPAKPKDGGASTTPKTPTDTKKTP